MMKKFVSFVAKSPRRRALAFVGGCVLIAAGTVGFDSCKKTSPAQPPPTPAEQKAEYIAYARDVANSLESVAKIVKPQKPKVAAALDSAIKNANRVIDAIERDAPGEVKQLLAEIMPVVTDLYSEYGNNQNVLIGLAAADIALHFFANHFVTVKAGAAAAPRTLDRYDQKILQFKQQPARGCQIDPQRCAALGVQ